LPKPKILLVDLPENVANTVAQAGFNVQAGTFGRPYTVAERQGYVQVSRSDDLPNYTEQEVIIIDLTAPATGPQQRGQGFGMSSPPGLYTEPGTGKIDPRPLAALGVCQDWHRVVEAGGNFVVFAQPRVSLGCQFFETHHGTVRREDKAIIDTWSFLPLLSKDNLEVIPDHGYEVRVTKSLDFIEAFLHRHQLELEFTAVLRSAIHTTAY
jgi:hypothetical protein